MDFPAITKHITTEKMIRISGAGNIHSSEELAKEKGLGGIIVQGGQLCGYLNEMLVKTFGEGYVRGGEIAVSFIHRVRPGDSVTTHGKVTASSIADGIESCECEVWLENQSGEKVAVGTAKASRKAMGSEQGKSD